MKKAEVHRWIAKTEYFDVSDGTEISKQLMLRDYDIIKTTKNIKIENFTGIITYTRECERKRQLKLKL